MLNAVMGRAHVAALEGDLATAKRLYDDGQRIFDKAGTDTQEASDYAVPEWRMAVYTSLLLARMGDGAGAVKAQDIARRLLPESLPRFATHLDLHTALMLTRAGDRKAGLLYGQAALDRLPPEKQSITLKLLMREIRGSSNVGILTLRPPEAS